METEEEEEEEEEELSCCNSQPRQLACLSTGTQYRMY